MVFYGMLVLLTGVGLLVGAGGIVRMLHGRYGVPYALLTVGVITSVGALIVQVLVLRGLDHALLGILPIGALAIGLAAGFTDEFARLLGYQYLAPGAVTRPQALMIGAGHGFTETIYTGLIAITLGLALMTQSTAPPTDRLAALSAAIAEALNGLLPIIMHMALSWLVLQVFLRGQLYWVFVAIFAHAVVEIMATLLGPSDTWPVVVWRVLIAVLSLIVIARVRPATAASGDLSSSSTGSENVIQ